MAQVEKTVFISYRRTDVYTALAVYENLKNQGYDVFFDYRSISSGDFEQIITSNIRARAHFILILTPTALDRCNEPGDWLRREIELAIDEKRNIVPLFFKGFRFGGSLRSGVSKWLRVGKPDVLTGKLKDLSRYNGLNVHEDYFEEAMSRLRTEYLNKPLVTVLHPVTTEVLKVVEEEQNAADEALRQKEVSKSPVKLIEETTAPKKEFPKPLPLKSETKKVLNPKPMSAISWRKAGGIAGILGVIAFFVWGGINLSNNLSSTIPNPTQTFEYTRTNMPMSTKIFAPLTPSPTRILISPMPTLTTLPTPIDIKVGKDGMNLLYVPASEFKMGSENGADNEKPVHTVYVDAFWIDETEVTNAMFAYFVDATGYTTNAEEAGKSWVYQDEEGDWLQIDGADWSHPSGPSSRIFEIMNHPVVNVSWNDAQAYCAWVERRLPTEAEWEKSASWDDGNQQKYTYPWGNEFNGNLLNFCDKNCSLRWAYKKFDDGYIFTAPVKSYPNGVSQYGVFDMAGNVLEWVDDRYSAYPGNTASNSDYRTTFRVVRGGSWFLTNNDVRTTNRIGMDPMYTSDIQTGFRCAMNATS